METLTIVPTAVRRVRIYQIYRSRRHPVVHLIFFFMHIWFDCDRRWKKKRNNYASLLLDTVIMKLFFPAELSAEIFHTYVYCIRMSAIVLLTSAFLLIQKRDILIN